eukprot:SM000010S04219  [mRNA]  locus=s10:336260:338124:+ [translate_table: standard]
MEHPGLEVVYEDYEMAHMAVPYVAGFLAFREVQPLVRLVERLRQSQPSRLPQVLLVDGNGILHHKGEYDSAGSGSTAVVQSDSSGIPSSPCWAPFLAPCRDPRWMSAVTDGQPGTLYRIRSGLPLGGADWHPYYWHWKECAVVDLLMLHIDGLTAEGVRRVAEEKNVLPGDYVRLVGSSGRAWGAALKSHEESSKPVFISPGHMISLETAVEVVAGSCKFRVPEPVRQVDKIHIGMLGIPSLSGCKVLVFHYA